MSTIRSEIELRHIVSLQKADFQLHGFSALESALSLVANPRQVLVQSSICLRTAIPCISNGEEAFFVLTGTDGYPMREAFVNFGRIMYDTNLGRGLANDSFYDRPFGRRHACWATMYFISPLAAFRLAFISH